MIMSELIEHLVDTDSAVDEVRRVLRPGGVLLLSTPNLAAWFNRGLVGLGIQPVFSEVSLRGIYGRPGHRGRRAPAPVHPAGAGGVPGRSRLRLRARPGRALPRRAPAAAPAGPCCCPAGRRWPASCWSRPGADDLP